MKKNKNRLGRSLKSVMSDINSISITNRYIRNCENNKDLNEVLDSNLIDRPIDLEKIGSILKEEREKRSLKIEEISNALNLRRPIIEAIENGLWERLPHEVYVRGYVKKYAGLLKLDDLILPHLNIKKSCLESQIALGNDKNIYKKQLVTNKFSRIFSKTSFLYTVAVVLIISAFIFLNTLRENEENEKLEKAIRVSNSFQSIEKQQVPILQNNKRLMVTCHERTWISVIMDGKEKKEFILNPGEVIILNANERFDILVGNAGGIKFLLNGKDVEFSGASGQVKRISL